MNIIKPSLLLKFATEFSSKIPKNTPNYKKLPFATEFKFFSTKFNQWTIIYQYLSSHQYSFNNKYLICIKTHDYFYLTKNDLFDHFHKYNTQKFESLEDAVNYIIPNWKKKLPKK